MQQIILFILLCLYTILPGVVANMMPVFVRKINFLNIPVDFNKKWKSRPIFGSHKTYRGFFFGVLGAIFVVYIQKQLYQYEAVAAISFFNFNEISFVLVGILIGLGVLFGDLIESFFKRRANIKPGAMWFPWDQIDSTIGGLIFISLIKIPTWQMTVFLLLIVPMLHVFFNHLGYWLRLKETKW